MAEKSWPHLKPESIECSRPPYRRSHECDPAAGPSAHAKLAVERRASGDDSRARLGQANDGEIRGRAPGLRTSILCAIIRVIAQLSCPEISPFGDPS